jgi:hypothetical protein
MNVTINEVPNKKRTYPYIGKCDNGTIVLFTSHSTGTVLGGTIYSLGYYNNTWVESDFDSFDGEIILEND